jgi:hypothetical protein
MSLLRELTSSGIGMRENENAWPDCPAATEKSGEIIATLLQDSYDWAFDPVI